MKKILVFILAVALLCSIAVGTTLTYFTDTDFDANTMTVGEVKIEQLEQQRDGDAYVPFDATNTKLYPYTGKGDMVGGWLKTAENAVDKIVSVKNTGSETAYIRTLFAFEAVNGNDPVAAKILHVNYNSEVGVWEKLAVNPITITKTVNGAEVTTQYYVYSFTYTNALAGGVTSEASLKQIALDYQQGNAFSDAVGGKYDILVLSQAVQYQGFATADAAFTAAFPIDATELVNWFKNLPIN